MSRRRNQQHKENKRKAKSKLFDIKAAFVAGIAVIAVCINDIVGLCIDVPNWLSILEFVGTLILFYFALGTEMLDKVLNTEGVNKFGSYLTVFSVVEFLIGRIMITSAKGVELVCNWNNSRFQAVLVLSILSAFGIVGAIYLLLYRYPKK